MSRCFEFPQPFPPARSGCNEVKYDGYRLWLERDGDRVRGGCDWSRYPWIVESALRNRHNQFVIDGEAVALGMDGASDFNALHSRKYDHEVQLLTKDTAPSGTAYFAASLLVANPTVRWR